MAQLKKDSPVEDRKAAFLSALEETGNISVAARRAKTPRRTAYNWRDADKDFAKAWDAAAELGTDALEDEATRRAKDGTIKPIYQGGKLVGKVREFSDTLMIFLLKARRPDKFKDRTAGSIDLTSGGKRIPAVAVLSLTGLSDNDPDDATPANDQTVPSAP